MAKILLSLGSIVFVAAVVASGTTAFFGDQEASTGNTFSAGAIDLKIDNESYYNGEFNEGTSWELKDLEDGNFFFHFLDLKPDDEGEDTISLHVDDNDAWACMDITVTANEENGCNEPEALVDDSCGIPGEGEGELAGLLNFVWWADDGDNVLEKDEVASGVFSQGLFADMTQNVVLADSTGEGVLSEEPLVGLETYYIGKAWCYGDLTLDPFDQDEDGKTGSNGPLDRGTGIQCDGTGLGNESQTDGVMGDISFRAIQSRNNPGFDCRGDCEIDTEETLVPGSGFEDPEVTNGAKWEIFDSVAGVWNVEWRGDIPATYGGEDRPVPAHLEIHEGVLGDAAEGNQYAELDSDWDGPGGGLQNEPASISIYQDVVTVPGRKYEIRYKFAPRPNTPADDNNLEVKVDGVIVDSTGDVAGGGGAIAWQERSAVFTATSASTEIRFTDQGTANSLGTFLDDIRLYEEVCELPQV